MGVWHIAYAKWTWPELGGNVRSRQLAGTWSAGKFDQLYSIRIQSLSDSVVAKRI
jgi:hypothetical protein